MHRLAYTNIIKVFTRKHLGSVALKDVVVGEDVLYNTHKYKFKGYFINDFIHNTNYLTLIL